MATWKGPHLDRGVPMAMAHEMRRLRAEHVAIVTLSRFMMGMVTSPIPPRPTELASVRGMLSETLVRHLKCEDWALYPRLKARGDPELSRMANEFVDEMGHIAAQYTAYDARWTPEMVEAYWPDFCEETIGILEALGMRIEREDDELYPAAEALIDPGTG